MNELTLVWGTLAQAATGGGNTSSPEQATWWLLGLLIGVLAAFVVTGVVVFVIRKRAMQVEPTQADIPLTLAELRHMHDTGEIDDEEMETLKRVITEQTRRGLEPEPKDTDEDTKA